MGPTGAGIASRMHSRMTTGGTGRSRSSRRPYCARGREHMVNGVGVHTAAHVYSCASPRAPCVETP